MYKLRLNKGMSYHGVVEATRKKPEVAVDEKEVADYLVGTGYFTLIGENEEAEDEGQANEEGSEDDLFDGEEAEDEGQETPLIAELQGMTKAELTEYAENSGIDLTGCKTKDAMLQRILEAVARADAAREALRS